MQNQPAGIIFDFDGVVVDSISAHLRAWCEAVDKMFGIPLREPDRLIGHSTVNIAMTLADEAGRPELAPGLVTLKRQILESRGFTVDALPGAREIFVSLSQSSIPWGIASNANRAFIEKTLDSLGIAVPVIVAVEDVQNPKPAPDVFLQCARILSIPPTAHQRTMVFEDSIHGIRAAIRAGMFAVGVTTQHDDRQLRKAGALGTCRDLKEALDLNWVESAPF